MSAIGGNAVWATIPKENLNSKYEKCLNITEEIYKRINITFQIKKLEGGAQSDLSDQSDQIDSNDLSNETDLFACDKSTSIPSSDPETKKPISLKYINNNNNVEMKKKTVVYKRPRKRFRKRVKKHQVKASKSDSDGSSDEALPLSRVVELDTAAASPDHAGVPNILILTKDVKPKILSEKNDRKTSKSNDSLETDAQKGDSQNTTQVESGEMSVDKRDSTMKCCNKCTVTFRSDRGLKRHLETSHNVVAGETSTK